MPWLPEFRETIAREQSRRLEKVQAELSRRAHITDLPAPVTISSLSEDERHCTFCSDRLATGYDEEATESQHDYHVGMSLGNVALANNSKTTSPALTAVESMISVLNQVTGREGTSTIRRRIGTQRPSQKRIATP